MSERRIPIVIKALAALCAFCPGQQPDAGGSLGKWDYAGKDAEGVGAPCTYDTKARALWFSTGLSF